MNFLAPERLLLLLLIAGLIAAYVLMQARRRTYAARFTNLALLDRVVPKTPGWRRHVPAVAFLFTLALLVLSFARPADVVDVPRERATVLLVIDVSTSMQATDVAPTRFEAARDAAKAFVEALPPRFNVALVTFAGSASLVVPPTTDRAAVVSGLDSMQMAQRTAIGEGVFTGLDGLRAFVGASGGPAALPPGVVSDSGPAPTAEPVPARMVLLSDGENTAGRSPEEAARAAAEADVPISTIAYGTPTGSIDVGGEHIEVPADGETLEAMAATTGGAFYEAASGDELESVYDDIGTSVIMRQEQREIAVWFAGLALLCGFAAAAGSLVWFGRLP